MGSHYNPRILTNGLVLHLDAANIRSYPGSGTAWTDLSGLGNNGTLTNGPTFNANNAGSIVFDGTNDWVTNDSTLSISATLTLSAWIRHNTLPDAVQRYLSLTDEVGVIRHDGSGNNAGALHFYVKTSGTLKQLKVNASLVINTWYYVVGTWDGTNLRLYKNASEIASSVPGGTLNGGNLGYFLSLNTESLNGNIAQASIYNRALSAAEIRQNFNATRGRFRI